MLKYKNMEIIYIISTLVFATAFIISVLYKPKPTIDPASLIDKELEVDKMRYQSQIELESQQKSLQSEYEAKKLLLEKDNEVALSKIRLEIISELKAEEKEMRKRALDLQESIDKKESFLNDKLEKFEEEKKHVLGLKDEIDSIKARLVQKESEVAQKEAQQQVALDAKLTEIAKLTKEEAKDQILEVSKVEMGSELLEWQKKMLENAEEDAVNKAREIVALAVQRCSSEVANEFTITTVKLPDEDAKGKIIGKGGRNIQWLEKTLGVELVIDETPEVVTISGFNSIRRHIAKKTLEKLLEDGRIHPASIEEMYEKSKGEIAQEIAEAGQWAVNELGIYDFPAKLIRIIGRLKYRTSYGQNMLRHSVEMAKLASLLAKEMNVQFPQRKPVDVNICIKGALLHDIGKAIDEETTPKGNHVDLGEKVCETFGLDWRIRKCVSSHHDESYYDEENGFCLEAALVDACDNISGGRMGARKETGEAYFQRMESLEKIGETTPGVTKSWIMRGSRELWVFFDTEKITPSQMHVATREIAKRIQTEVKYPGEIKIVGLWEDKIVEYAA
jgi:ribonucrease Y